jgi:hypothetical protein
VDRILPLDYPLPATNPLSPRSDQTHPMKAGFRPYDLSLSPPESDRPVLHVHSSSTQLHCRPAELYLGASSSQNRLNVGIFWDGNVFEEAVVEEWLDEVLKATLWYLGLDQQAKL